MSTALTEKPKNDLKSLLNSDKMREQFKAALPQHLSPERFIRVATTALMRTPSLVECTQESFFKCLLDLSAWGLEPDGRRAHLIPFKRRMKDKGGNWTEVLECTLIVDWKGLSELALRSGLIAKLHADIVCENDLFTFNLGEIEEHRINFKAPRGEAYAAYARAVTKDGATFVAVMTRDEILSVRDGSQGWIAFEKGYTKSSPWDPKNKTSELEMWKKTAFRRLSKWLPLSAEFRDAIERDDDADGLADLRNVTPPTERPARASRAPQSLEDAFTQPAEAEVVEPVAEPAPEQPAEAPVETPEEAPEVSPGQMIDDIKSCCESAELTLAQFEGKCRGAGVLGATETVSVKLKRAKLETIWNNADAIIRGTYNAGGDQ